MLIRNTNRIVVFNNLLPISYQVLLFNKCNIFPKSFFSIVSNKLFFKKWYVLKCSNPKNVSMPRLAWYGSTYKEANFNGLRNFHSTSFCQNQNKKPEKNEFKNVPQTYIYIFGSAFVGLLLGLFYFHIVGGSRNRITINWSQFVNQILPSGEVQGVYVHVNEPHKATISLLPGASFNNKNVSVIETSVAPGENLELMLRIEENRLGIKGSNSLPVTSQLTFDNSFQMLFLGAYILSTFIFMLFAGRRLNQMTKSTSTKKRTSSKSPPDSFGSFNIFKAFDTDIGFAKNTNVKFEDVAGMQEAKQEVIEFVQFLKTPENYQRLGAKMPRGCLLTGPPGVGKTLLAKAVATEAGVPFIAKAGSDFVEMIGGLGARRIRQLFQKARESEPCIVYIDELDALGAARSGSESRIASSTSEKDQTLNQILVEMDGMLSKQHQVIVLASTNRPDILDKALLRPGRFDRVIHIELPNRQERKEIIERHLRDIKLADDPETYSKQLASETPGMSGADLANISNEAAIYAAREGDDQIERKHLNYALERVTSGAPKSTTSLSPEERRKVAVHESGHALVGWLLEHTNALAKITIIPRSKGVLGVTRTVPSDRYLHSQDQFFDNMCMALGGRAAENIIFGNVTQGAQDDLDRVTKMAYSQIKEFGFNDAVGPVSFKPEGNFQPRPYSEALATIIDAEVMKLVTSAYKRAQEVLSDNKELLETLYAELLERETLTYDEVSVLIGPPPFKDKKQATEIPFQDVDSAAPESNKS